MRWPLNEQRWQLIGELLPGFQPPAWETLLLNAKAMLPETGPAITLAVTALETLMGSALDYLAKQRNVDPDLWGWITDRGQGQYDKEPSLVEQFDNLLEILAGRSLRKSDPKLWEAFRNLKSARNNFLHRGKAAISQSGTELSRAEAYRLIEKAWEITDWVAALLPDEMRSRRLRPGET